MALKQINQPTYILENDAGESVKEFEGMTFSGSSGKWLVYPEAVAFGKKHGVLQSLREAAGFRCYANGADEANFGQAGRLIIVHLNHNGTLSAAYDDLPDNEGNLGLAKAKEIYDVHTSQGKCLLSVSDDLVRAHLNRAEKAGRIVPVLTESPLELSLKQESDGSSAFDKNPHIRAALLDMAKPYAQFLRDNERTVGRVYGLTAQELTALGVTAENAEVRFGGLGDVNYVDISSVDLDRRFNYVGGRARGVAHAQKNSP